MRRMLIDPALAGGVVLTTVTDVVGFMTFLDSARSFSRPEARVYQRKSTHPGMK